MSAKIGLISDVHATVAPLQQALAIFEQQRVDLILCTGDIAGYGAELEQSVELLVASGCVTILGNHDIWHLDHPAAVQKKGIESYLYNLPVTWDSIIEGKRIFAVHASPPDSISRGITLLDQYENILSAEKELWAQELKKFNYDVLVVGHTHQVFAELLGRTMVINPGSTVFNHTCAILSLPELQVSFVPLSGKVPRKVWHWGMMTKEGFSRE